jgi:hypothetical protein
MVEVLVLSLVVRPSLYVVLGCRHVKVPNTQPDAPKAAAY